MTRRYLWWHQRLPRVRTVACSATGRVWTGLRMDGWMDAVAPHCGRKTGENRSTSNRHGQGARCMVYTGPSIRARTETSKVIAVLLEASKCRQSADFSVIVGSLGPCRPVLAFCGTNYRLPSRVGRAACVVVDAPDFGGVHCTSPGPTKLMRQFLADLQSVQRPGIWSAGGRPRWFSSHLGRS